MIRTIKRGLLGLALAGSGLFFAAPAFAAVYNGNCANYTTGTYTSVTINDSTSACNIGVNVTSSGPISITASGPISAQSIESSNTGAGTGDITITGQNSLTALTISTNNSPISITAVDAVQTNAISTTLNDITIQTTGSDANIQTEALTTTTGFINVQSTGDTKVNGAVMTSAGYLYVNSGGLINITGAVQTMAQGHILLFAQKSLASGPITGASGFNVDLKAYMGGSPSAFVTNPGGAPTNGTSGPITAGAGALYITNGTSGSAGDITVTNATDLVVNTGSGNRYLILNANNGKITLPTGTINVDGTATSSAGQIELIANTVSAPNNTTLSTQQVSTTGALHGIDIAAQTVTYGGSSGLTINANGPGTPPGGAFVYLFTEGATTISDNMSPTSSYIYVSTNPNQQGAISYTGSGLTVTANGDNSYVDVSAFPITFSGGPVTLQATGTTSHTVNIVNNVTLTGAQGLTFGAGGAVLIDASGNGGDAGTVQIEVDHASMNATSFTATANGPTTGAGNGGTVFLYSTQFTQSSSAKGTISAKGASAGTGNGGTITFYPGSTNVTLGIANGEFVLSATGGSTGGNGGSITVEPDTGNITLDASSAAIADVNVLGANGNGGTIELDGSDINSTKSNAVLAANAGSGTGNGGTIALYSNTLEFTGTTSSISANGGKVAGNGGMITVSTGSGLTIGSGTTGDVKLTADAPKSGNGGTISLTSYYCCTNALNTADLTVTAKGQGNGGTVNYTGGPLSITGSLAANGAGNGTGGTLNFVAGYFTFNGTQSFTANGLGTGMGGNVTLNATYAGETSSLTLGASTTLEATSKSGSGGAITITSASQPVAITGAGLTVTAGGDGTGGDISVTSTTNTLSLTGNLNANAPGNASGGTITLVGDSINLPSGSNTVLSATSAAVQGTGIGGKINVTATAAGVTIGTANNQLSLNASNTASGGGGIVGVTAAGPLTAQGAAINVAAGPNSGAAPNLGGTILLTTSSGSVSASGTFQASGGPLGAGGTINFQSAQDIDLADQTQLLAQGNGAGGVGGEITLGAGTANQATGTINYATSNISINASSQSATGGNILIQTADPTQSGVLQISGPITNNAALAGAGTVTINNKYATGLRVDTANISALNGQITFQSNQSSVNVTGTAPTGMAGPYFGPVSLSGTNLTLKVSGSATLLLGDFDATGDIQIQTDIGNMMSSGSDVVETTGTNGTVTFLTTSGEVGTGSSSPVNVAADNVDFNFGSNPANGTSIYLNVTGDVTVENVASYGNVFLTGNNNITLSQNIQTTQGNVGIQSNGGAIVLNANKRILAQEGTLYLQGTTGVTLGTNSTLKAETTTTNTALGNVAVTLLGPPSGNTTTTPANVTVTSGAQYVLFGAMGITANAPTNTLSSTGERYLDLDTNGLSDLLIVLNGGVKITAAGH